MMQPHPMKPFDVAQPGFEVPKCAGVRGWPRQIPCIRCGAARLAVSSGRTARASRSPTKSAVLTIDAADRTSNIRRLAKVKGQTPNLRFDRLPEVFGKTIKSKVWLLPFAPCQTSNIEVRGLGSAAGGGVEFEGLSVGRRWQVVHRQQKYASGPRSTGVASLAEGRWRFLAASHACHALDVVAHK
jgi:hypothetical protein